LIKLSAHKFPTATLCKRFAVEGAKAKGFVESLQPLMKLCPGLLPNKERSILLALHGSVAKIVAIAVEKWLM
jgi:hypothetical protein